ncbi:thiamine pyrophosphate-binding protein [Vineibacter terrae]|uniref:Thiamine pyrophosphate-binding protein n=1 Tax=Vineibacter terrae TaxID=2586908 RepID=A0A5C8PBT1_9HYPH|nr:thiamine pyrophosphate-dependent enzyme [Vineibacter terrae]TXL70908.1 thiamine pyrophosphate-binding protein [Vineibacter terrae]
MDVPSVPAHRDAAARRARAIAQAGGVAAAIEAGLLADTVDCTVSEALVIGLLKQGVRKYLAIFGHGSTDLAEVLRLYAAAGVVRVHAFRNEVAMAHAATALRWQYGEQAAVVTSIGPGALQAMAASLAAASNGVGVWHIYGDETTHDEGFNMQQIPKHQQGLYGQLTAVMGESYVLHTPQALRAALRRGSIRVNHPYGAGPFYLLLPINVQPQGVQGLRLASLPDTFAAPPTVVAGDAPLAAAVDLVHRHRRIVIKAGGGTRRFAKQIRALAGAVDGVVVLSPGSLGVLADDDPRNMHVGGSKGSLSGNAAMAEADLLIAVGTRAVCQSDCSGVGYPAAQAVININGDLADAAHYNRTVMLPGDIGEVVGRLVAALSARPPSAADAWRAACAERKRRWQEICVQAATCPPLLDDVWQRPVLTQPAAIGVVQAMARAAGATCLFDAGDVQANGFQLARDTAPLQTITEAGASYMGFAASALVASGMADRPQRVVAVTGDGSFMMNPQVLIDGVEHGVRGTVVMLDNRRMAAISALQVAQYGAAFATSDGVEVDYVALAGAVKAVRALHGGHTEAALRAALAEAFAYDGLSFVHVPVYFGPDPRAGLGTYGRWNVGNWVDEVQDMYRVQNL